MDRLPVLLDTDIGNDIDDAVALAYLARQPRCELLGVTTVSGDVQKRAALAEVVLRAAGREDVPIYPGRSEPLLKGRGQPEVGQYETIRRLPHRLDREPDSAVEFLRRTIRSRPHEITLLTIGPYSNVALLFALDPEIPFLLKGVVSMGGRFFGTEGPEWNALVDSTASAMVYHAPRRDHLSVGLNVTLQCRMPAAEVRRRFTGEPLATVLTLAEAWFSHTEEITFHDPLAATLIFHPGLCGTRKGRIAVDETNGSTTLVEGEGPDRVADTVDVPAFFEEFFAVASKR